METKIIIELLGRMDVSLTDPEISAFKNVEDGSEYAVWKITSKNLCFVLKEAKVYEFHIYKTFFEAPHPSVPRLFATAQYENKDYLLMEYVEGQTLFRLDRSNLPSVLDALIGLQENFWNFPEPQEMCNPFKKILARRIERGTHLKDATLEEAYQGYLQQFKTLPRTLCHDDLLPFNVIVSDTRAVMIDWEIAGILPYPTSLARLLAHATDEEDAFFFITADDKAFAIQYYYDHFVAQKGISYESYRLSLDYFLLYEYCEWIMLGHKYGSTDSERFRQYQKLAKDLAEQLSKNTRKENTLPNYEC